MKDEMLRVTIEGIRPLLLHNGRLADPLDEYTKRLKVLAKQRDRATTITWRCTGRNSRAACTSIRRWGRTFLPTRFRL